MTKTEQAALSRRSARSSSGSPPSWWKPASRQCRPVFSALLVTDSGRLTAAQLSALLGASPAAISGAVRYLGQVGIISREREPGSRRDVYLVLTTSGTRCPSGQDQVLARWINRRQGRGRGARPADARREAARRLGLTSSPSWSRSCRRC